MAVGRADLGHVVAARPQVDARREPGQRIGDRVGDGSRASRNVWRVRRYGSAGADVATTAATRGSAAAGEDRPDGAHRVAEIAADRHLRPGEQRLERGQRVEPELAGADRQRLGRVRAVAADVDRQAVEARGVEERAPSAASGRAPTPSRGSARRPGPGAPPRAGMNQAGRSRSLGADRQVVSNGRPRSAGVMVGGCRRG